MAEASNDQSDARVIVMRGNSVGLALMLAEDVPTMTRWNQDLNLPRAWARPVRRTPLRCARSSTNRIPA